MPELPSESTERVSRLKGIPKFFKPSPKLVFVLVIVLALAGFAAWSFYSYREAKEEVVRLSTLEGQQEVQRQEVEALLERVRGHMILPEDEEPTVATVSDVEALVEQQPFFKGTQNGDKVLVYVKSRKAIIYSPERDVIVNVGALIVDNQAVIEESEEGLARLDIELRNGTDTSGLAREVSSRLEKENSAFNFVSRGDASKKEYDKTIVVDLGKTDNKDLIASLGEVLGASTVMALPEGEQGSEAEVLIIVGEDQVESKPESPE